MEPLPVLGLARSDSSPESPQYRLTSQPLSVDAASRPPKRRRLDAPAPGLARTRTECVKHQVLPEVLRQVARFPADQVNTRLIISKVLDTVSTDSGFNREYEKSQGWISPTYEAIIAAKVAAEIFKLSRLPAYHFVPLTPGSELTSSPTPQRLPPQTPSPKTPESSTLLRTPLNSIQKRQRSRPQPVSPTNYRSKARALALRSDAETTKLAASAQSEYFSLSLRPYINAEDRRKVVLGTRRLVNLASDELRHSTIYHVDFTEDEAEAIRAHVRRLLRLPSSKRNPIQDLQRLMKKQREGKLSADAPDIMAGMPHELAQLVPCRAPEDVYNFFWDIAKKSVKRHSQMLRLERDAYDKQSEAARTSRIPALLFAREIEGHRGFGRMSSFCNFPNEFRKAREDNLELQAEWTNCAGDIATISWMGNGNFICGTTTHSDSHNQQYNKPGNLLLGSCSLGTLRAYPHHRIVRPIVSNGDNSTEAMRESQDPWLYASVVSSDYDFTHDRAFTSSFDGTVKVWKVEPSGASMALLGTWEHGGNVNFVVASKHPSGMVATAADVPSKAVRVYNVDSHNIPGSFFRSYSCLREDQGPEDWAYYPATVQWGRADGVEHLLLVGYSPRSLSGDDNDIPEDRRDSGEICLWNCITGERVKITTATTRNVFEVAWHPSQPSFIVATSPRTLNVDDNVRTQIHIFRPSDNPELLGGYSEVKCLDCPAADINELTITPNSFTFCYITAASTDGNVYVWDTALSDKPVHVLEHGDPIQDFGEEREKLDTGVKFTAWGTSPDRFYTGSSDGVVKIWNVRSEKPLVRDLLEVSAEVVCGSFSPDLSRLAIGDATGRVYLLSLDKEDFAPTDFVHVTLDGASRLFNRPKPFIPHPEPPAPSYDGMSRLIHQQSGVERAQAFLESGQLRLAKDPTVGAVQGPNYDSMGLYRLEAHLNGEPSQALLAGIERTQQENTKMYSHNVKFAKLREIPQHTVESVARHRENKAMDLDVRSLDEETRMELMMDSVSLTEAEEDEDYYEFEYEELPESDSETESEDGSDEDSDDSSDEEIEE